MVYEEAINITGLVELFQYTNRVTTTGGREIFVILILLTVYIIPFIYLILRHKKWEEASLAAGFMASITAILLRIAEITTVDTYIFFAIATIIIPLVIVFLRDKST